MPKKYIKRARKGVRTMKKRMGKGRVRTGISKPNLIVAKFPNKNPFPRRYVTKLHYSDIIGLSGAATFRSVDRVFRMNSCYDPDVTGVGHQPRYFDQFSTVYNYYRVLGCKVKVRYMPTDSTVPQQNFYMAIVPSNDPSNLNNTTYLNIAELPYSKTTFGNLYGSRATLSMYKKIHQIAGVAPSVVKNDDAFRANTGTSPSTGTFYHLVVGTLDETNLNLSGRLLVDVTYYVSWEDPVIPASS